MSAVGLDIGTYTIKAVNAKPGPKPQVLRTVEVFNTSGMSLPTEEGSAEKLMPLIESVFTDHKLPRNDVRVALPEQVVSTKIIAIPPLSDAELASAINWQAEQHIPIPVEELSLEYQILYRPPRKNKEEKMLVMLVGARKNIIDTYINMYIDLGIEPTMLETHTTAAIRAMGFTAEDPVTMMVTIGATTMDIAIVRGGMMVFVFSHLNGGQLLTRTIEQTIGLDNQQAEQYKRTYGLDEAQFEGKIRQALLPSVRVFVNEIKKAMQFYSNQYPGEQVQRILLSGGSAQLPGLVPFITSEVGTEVLVAAPFATATGEVPEGSHPNFAVAMGLIMREL